jgi:hypothetical protein
MISKAGTSPSEAASSASTHLLAAAIFKPEVYKVYQPLSRMLSDVMSTFYHVNVPEKLGMVFKMHATMRVSFKHHDPHPQAMLTFCLVAC